MSPSGEYECYRHGNYPTHLHDCPKCEEAEQTERLARARIPKRYAQKNINDYKVSTAAQKNSLRIAQYFIENFEGEVQQFGKMLVFLGEPGTGKTLLATLILQAIAPKHGGLYTEASEIIQSVRRSWRKESLVTEGEVIKYYVNQTLLVIDEIGAQYCTAGEQLILESVLGLRYAHLMPTILLTNNTYEELETIILGEKIIDRLNEIAVWVPFDWESFRQPAAAHSVQNAQVISMPRRRK